MTHSPQLLNFWKNKDIKIQKIGMCICFDSISVFYALWRNPRCALSLLSFEALLRCWGRAGVVSTCTASSVSIQSCWEQHTYTVFCVPRNSEKYLVWHESFSLKTSNSGKNLFTEFWWHTVRNLHFLSKNSTLISREKLSKKFWVKNSWKCWGFGLFSCWHLWFHEKNF